MGLAKGPATVGRIGYEERFDYTAIGSVVNLAARLARRPPTGKSSSMAQSQRLLRVKRSLTALGGRLMKGYDDELLVFRILFDQSDKS